MCEIFILNSLSEIKKDEWNSCFPGEIERYEYLLAVEGSNIAGFKFCYITAWQFGELMACMPAFLNEYSLDTTMDGFLKKLSGKIRAVFPNIMNIRLACLGSPCTESGNAGFHPDLNDEARSPILAEMVSAFETYAASQKYSLVGIKDVPDSVKSLWDNALHNSKYTHIYSLPTAYLDINFNSVDEYLSTLSAVTRKSMRRKLKSMGEIKIEYRSNIDDLLPEIIKLYLDTRNRSEYQFEELTEDYFHNVLANMQGRSFCTLYYAGERLMAANLLVHNNDTLIDKFFCMNSAEGRKYNLYFLSWFNNIEYCLKNNIRRYQSGQAYYENKVSLGSTLTNNWAYFKHSNFFVQNLLKFVAPKLMANDSAEAYMLHRHKQAA